jgi:hypothetical protein
MHFHRSIKQKKVIESKRSRKESGIDKKKTAFYTQNTREIVG